MKKIPDDEIRLRQVAKNLGVSLQHTIDPDTGKTDIPELQSRVINMQRSIREGRLWLVALISAIGSAVSALAAWTAVLMK